MTKSEKMALKLMPYTCPKLDEMGKDYIADLVLSTDVQVKTFTEFIEQIKKDITCPMRTALETACKRIIELEEKLQNGS